MGTLQVFLRYLKWHYSKAIVSSFLLWQTLLIFLFNFFSIKTLLGNFFTPWKRMYERYPKWYEFKEYFSSLVINTMMRIVGIIIRFFTVTFGLICILIFIVLFPAALILWLLLPFIIVGLFALGLLLIING